MQDNVPEPRGIFNMASNNPSIWLAICLPSSCTAQEINNVLNNSLTEADDGLEIHIQNCQSLDKVEIMTAGEIVSA